MSCFRFAEEAGDALKSCQGNLGKRAALKKGIWQQPVYCYDFEVKSLQLPGYVDFIAGLGSCGVAPVLCLGSSFNLPLGL